MPADKELMRAPKGMLDVLPPESARWMELVARFAELATRFGYGLVITPIVEHYEVFARVGETTDVVRKEMYDFVDRGGRRLALGPKAPRRSSARSCSTGRRRRGRCGTSRRTSAPSNRRPAGTGSTGSSVSRCWASTIPMSTSR